MAETPGPRFSHDDTFKTLFQQVEVIRDLLAAYLPDLEGFTPRVLRSTEHLAVDARSEPRLQGRHPDLVWVLERGAERVNLCIEHQSTQDPSMSVRMVENTFNLWQSGAQNRFYSLVFSTAQTPFCPWLVAQAAPDIEDAVVFIPGPLLDIHAYPLPSFNAAPDSLPRCNLVSCVIVLARLQWALRSAPQGYSYKDVYDLAVHVFVDWLKPLVADSPRLGNYFAVWCAAGMEGLWEQYREGKGLPGAISSLTFAKWEHIMVTVQDLVTEGQQIGKQEGILLMLTEYVKLNWSEAVAADFQDQLNNLHAQGEAWPTMEDLHERRKQDEPPLPPTR